MLNAGALAPLLPAAEPLARAALPAAEARRGGALRLRGLAKRFGERQVLKALDLRIAPGEFVAIVGRSGCGKSTLLRLLAGLETPSEGHIEGLAADDTRFMFQDARLLPWARVLDNVALGLHGAPRSPQAAPAPRGGEEALGRHGGFLGRADARERAARALTQVGLAERGGDWPARLSGGQRQRVALARALVHTPRLLLLDEPLGALDALTRIEMQGLIEGLWQRHGFTALLVTHDVSEALALADRVLLIEDGGVALDWRVDLPRPRRHGPEFAALEQRLLERVLLTRPDVEAAPATAAADPVAAGALRWAW
ncbi:ATP-binding cassette domain-containing protein [Roseateles sp. DAIF2]|uniref:ATP-binding cassette domain-containing protein n=1 Tax=Roseateles sp. DAIF2 TaxID=2714952 RepID=UPI0018A2C677|nr:ATP-binding cassette domain-containing protein [Roseateles sp. DAIF2]